MENNNILDAAIIHLITEERFFAELIMNMKRYIDVDLPAVAGVNITDSVNLYIQPYMWAQLSLLEQVDVLKHECYHVMQNHFARWKELYPEGFELNKDKNIIDRLKDSIEFKIGNIAGDYASNEYLPNLPKNLKIIDNKGNPVLEPDEYQDEKGQTVKNPNAGKQVEGRFCFVDDWKANDPTIDKYQHMEYYYERLKQEQKKNGSISIVMSGPGGEPMTVDDHSLWDKGAKDPEFITEKVKQLVNKAAESAKGAGSNIPPRIEEMINRLNYKPNDLRNDLRRFAAKTANSIRESSRKVRNRRYGILYPGYKSQPILNLALVIDDSGSMYTELLEQILAECAKIHSLGTSITIITCDDKVHQVEKFEPGKKFNFAAMDGRGGTSFAPGIAEAIKHEVDGIIYFTDGDANDISNLTKPKMPVLWAMAGGCKNRVNFGSETTITINKKASNG